MSRKQIDEMAKVLESTCDETECNHPTNCDLCKATRLYNAGYHKQEWISVEDRSPEEKVNCLIHYKHAYCDNDGYWSIGVSFYDGHEFHIGLEYKVTHWMPLPEAPKMKGGAE